MSTTSNSGNGSSSAFADWVIRKRWLVLVGSLAIAMAAGFGGSRLASPRL
jgi:hypothetical protein